MADGRDGTPTALSDSLAALFARAQATAMSEADIAKLEARQRKDLRVEALASSGLHLPDEDRTLVLSGKLDRQRPACVHVATWAKGAPKPGAALVDCTPGILVMCGGTGTGKTLAGAWWLSHVRGRAITIHEAIRIYSGWKRSHGGRAADEAEERLERLGRIDALLVDELGQESDSDAEHAREVLHWLVDRRQSARRRTLILTNLRASDLRDRFARGTYDGRTASRLERHGAVVEVGGTDMRRR